MGIEEEAQSWRETVDIQAPGESELDVAEAVGEGECKLLLSRRSGFPDVIAGDTERLVRGNPLAAVLHHVADQAQVRAGRKQPFLLSDVLLEDVGLQSSIQRRDVNALALRGNEVHAENRHCWTRDRHRRRHCAKINSGEQQIHIRRGVDRNTAMTYLTQTAAVVGIPTHQRWHIERHAEPAATRCQDHLVALVGLLGVAESGELSNGPRTSAIATRVEAPSNGKLPGPAD